MKRTLIAIACGAVLALSAVTAQAATLTLSSSTYLGSIDPGVPASSADDVAFINELISREEGTYSPVSIGGNVQTYTVVRTTNEDNTALPTAVEAGAQLNGTSQSFDVTNFAYLLVKYGNTAYVWYVADINATVQLDSTLGFPGSGLSGSRLFNPSSTTPPNGVPDGGTTLGLLGLAMLGLGYARQRIA